MTPEVLTGDNKKKIGSNFSSLTELTIKHCDTLSSLEQFVQPDYVPGIRKINIVYCERLVSLSSFKDLRCLEVLKVRQCPNVNSTQLLAPSLTKLELEGNCGNLADNMDCSALTDLRISNSHLTSINLQMWNLPALKRLYIYVCRSLAFIGKSEPGFSNHSHQGDSSSAGTFPSLTDLTISNCSKLQIVDDLPGSFPSLKKLNMFCCQLPNGQMGMKLPSSLEKLELHRCEDLSAWFPRCLENLGSLWLMEVTYCKGELSIPGHMWSSNLASLRLLKIEGCPDLVSVGLRVTLVSGGDAANAGNVYAANAGHRRGGNKTRNFDI